MEVSNVRAMEKGGRFGRFDEEKSVLLLLGIEAQFLGRSARGLVSIPALIVEFSSSLSHSLSPPPHSALLLFLFLRKQRPA
jgi:hypothetical protein